MFTFKYLRKYAAQYLKNTAFRNNISFLIFFVTSRCNCRCTTCFYWKELGRTDELSLSEIKSISASVGNFHTLLFSGGEPFLREDILEIARVFIEQNKLSILSIPTNGTHPAQITEFCEQILKDYPRLTLSIAVSLDGFKRTHDEIRGVDGVFDKATETIGQLSKLKIHYGNLEVAVNTVVTDRNIDEVDSFADFVYNNFKNLDYHEFELLRGQPRDTGLSLPPLEKVKYIHRFITRNCERYLKRNGASSLEKLSVIGLLLFTQNIKERSLLGRKNYYTCSAGRNIGVVDANGDVKLCELLRPVGNLRNVNYEFSCTWNSTEANGLRAEVIKRRCNCTHICFIKLTASSHFKTLFYIIYGYLFYKIRNNG